MSLSDKIMNKSKTSEGILYVKDVKEFINKLVNSRIIMPVNATNEFGAGVKSCLMQTKVNIEYLYGKDLDALGGKTK